MLKLLTLNNIGKSGLNSDIAKWELGPEYITSGQNFRVRDGSISPFNGSRLVFPSPDTAPGDSGYLMFIRVAEGDYWVQCTRHKIWASSDAVGWADISRKDYGISNGGEVDWTGSQLGQIVVLNHPEVGPEYWNHHDINPGSMLSLPFNPDETWANKGLTCKVMRSHKNFLIALNLNPHLQDVDLTRPNGYRISHPAEENAPPFTWDTTDRSSLAVQGQLGSDGGEILDGRSLRDSFMVYSQDAIDALDFNPNSEFFWSRRELSSTVGILSTNCVTEVKGKHFMIVDGDIVMTDGQTITSIIHNRLLRRFNAKNNELTKVSSFVARNDWAKEVWFCVPEDDSPTPIIAYVYNWHDDSWSLRDLPPNTIHTDYGVLPTTEQTGIENPKTWASMDPLKEFWSNQILAWGVRSITALNEAMAGLDQNGNMYEVDPTGGIDEDNFDTVIERTDYPLDGHTQTNTIIRAYPHASGDEFSLQFGSQQQVGGQVKWESSQVFKPGTDRKLDFRTTGEAFAWRATSIGSNRFRLSGLDLEYSPAGRR